MSEFKIACGKPLLALAVVALLSLGSAVQAEVSNGGGGAPAPRTRHTFQISGSVCCLTPGSRQPVPVKIKNPHGYRIEVKRLVTRVTSGPSSCEPSENIRIRQSSISNSRRITVRPRSTKALLRNTRPSIELLNLPTNQDACRNQKFGLRYTGSAIAPGRPTTTLDGVNASHREERNLVADAALPLAGVGVGVVALIGLVWIPRRRRTRPSHTS